jgi:hypothetical protein
MHLEYSQILNPSECYFFLRIILDFQMRHLLDGSFLFLEATLTDEEEEDFYALFFVYWKL